MDSRLIKQLRASKLRKFYASHSFQGAGPKNKPYFNCFVELVRIGRKYAYVQVLDENLAPAYGVRRVRRDHFDQCYIECSRWKYRT